MGNLKGQGFEEKKGTLDRSTGHDRLLKYSYRNRQVSTKLLQNGSIRLNAGFGTVVSLEIGGGRGGLRTGPILLHMLRIRRICRFGRLLRGISTSSGLTEVSTTAVPAIHDLAVETRSE